MFRKIRIAQWSGLVLLQGASVVFFLGDVTTELMDAGLVAHTMFEAMAMVALICGVVLGGREILRLAHHARRAEDALESARESFSALIHRRFAEWSLTLAESEVAMLLLKGFDIAEIARIRETAPGTVRAQLSHIYDKSGHPSRGRFVSSFLDVLIDRQIR